MNNDYLEKIYNEIKEVPYLINTAPKEEFPNCYYKGMKLISAFAKLGVPVRAKYAVFDWRKSPIPSNIIDLLSDDFEHIHFYVEAYIDNKWRTLDPSIDSKSAKLGFRAVDFKGDEKTCFHLIKVFSDEEQIERFMVVNEEADEFEDYFEKMTPFLTSFNKWIEAERAKL